MAEIESANIVAVSKVMGRNGGSFVTKELVYAYAMWISPAFHLKVIHAYDTLQTQVIAVADHAADDLLTNPLAYFEKVLAQAKQIQAERDLAIQQKENLQKVVGTGRQSLARFDRTSMDRNSMGHRFEEV